MREVRGIPGPVRAAGQGDVEGSTRERDSDLRGAAALAASVLRSSSLWEPLGLLFCFERWFARIQRDERDA